MKGSGHNVPSVLKWWSKQLYFLRYVDFYEKNVIFNNVLPKVDEKMKLWVR